MDTKLSYFIRFRGKKEANELCVGELSCDNLNHKNSSGVYLLETRDKQRRAALIVGYQYECKSTPGSGTLEHIDLVFALLIGYAFRCCD